MPSIVDVILLSGLKGE